MDVKGQCQKCDQAIQFDANNAGVEVVCPHCQLITKLLTPAMEAARQKAAATSQAASIKAHNPPLHTKAPIPHTPSSKAGSPPPASPSPKQTGIATGPAVTITHGSSQQPAPQPSATGTASEFLKHVRRKTCYPVLRFVIGLATVMMLLFAMIALVVPGSGMGLFYRLMFAAGNVVGAMFFYQACSLLIDIADAVLEGQRPKTT